jgi:hypothetical protein
MRLQIYPFLELGTRFGKRGVAYLDTGASREPSIRAWEGHTEADKVREAGL